MKRLWLMPIEPFDSRYTSQWLRWFERELPKYFETRTVLGKRLEGHNHGIVVGEFLDVYDTNYWKATQAAEMLLESSLNQLGENDVVLFLDAWNPAVEMLAYVRDAAKRPFKIVGLLHAGTYDPQDFLTQRGLGHWASHVERGWLKALDAVCVATRFHADLLTGTRGSKEKVHVTGFPLYAQEWAHHARPWAERVNAIVFPHRLAPEKQPEEFSKLVGNYSDFIAPRTHDLCATKDDYYKMLGSSRVVVSTALQETWGIAMLEAMSLGCWPVAPNDLSYQETIPAAQLYARDKGMISTQFGGARDVLSRTLGKKEAFPWGPTESEWYEGAIGRIARVCERL